MPFCMKACIDIQPAIAQRAGVGRYTKCLVEHLPPFAKGHELSLFYFDFKRAGSPFPVPGAVERANRLVPGRIVQRAWRTIRWPPFDLFSGPADVFHFTNFILPPLRKGRTVVTVHDLAFLRFPETMEARNYSYLKANIRHTVEKADAIVAISHFGGTEICELLGVPQSRIFPIPLAISPELQKPEPDTIKSSLLRLGLDRPYLLMVSTLEPRKNPEFLVEVFERLQNFDGLLVLAGSRGWRCEPILNRIANSPARDRIRRLDFVSDADLPSLYAGASCFVFPSLYEGFGFPPLEAMKCGTPVVCSTGGSLPEVVGDAAIVVPGYDVDAWVDQVDKVLTGSSLRHNLLEKGLARTKDFSWEKTAAQTWKLYERLAGGFA